VVPIFRFQEKIPCNAADRLDTPQRRGAERAVTIERLQNVQEANLSRLVKPLLDFLNDDLPLDFDVFTNTLKPKVKAKGKNLFMPLRLALTGKEHGPELKRIFPILGLETVRKRLERAFKT